MYIEFHLPNVSTGEAAYHHGRIHTAVGQWAKTHDVEYDTKLIRYTYRVVFKDDSLCNFFALSYTGHGKFRIVDPLNNLT